MRALARNDPRTPTMAKPTNDNEKPMNREDQQRTAFDRLREEITILRIEGTLFCFDPKEAKRRTGIIRSTLRDADRTERPVEVEIHPSYGQPSVLAYKIVQAIFLKMTEAGEPYQSVVAFTQRELARLVGRKNWGGADSHQLYQAMMQLQYTRISCSVNNKETKEYFEVNFMFLPMTLFSSKEKSITECVVQVNDVIVSSLNRRHSIWLNYEKLSALDPIASVMYKRLFYHFSNTYTSRKARSALKFEKDYEDVCREWLGGLKPERYASRIEKQLGRYLDEVQATGLISQYQISTRAKGAGFKLAFRPGEGFFEDYSEFYLHAPGQPTMSRQAVRDTVDPQPLQLVAYFHQLLGHKQDTFADKEKVRAAELLRRYSAEEVRDLIDYAVGKFKAANHTPDFFGNVLNYVPAWASQRTERTEIARRRAAAAACPICEGRGWVLVKAANGEELARPCNHGQAVDNNGQPAVH